MPKWPLLSSNLEMGLERRLGKRTEIAFLETTHKSLSTSSLPSTKYALRCENGCFKQNTKNRNQNIACMNVLMNYNEMIWIESLGKLGLKHDFSFDIWHIEKLHHIGTCVYA